MSHQGISFIKSGIRILGFALIIGMPFLADGEQSALHILGIGFGLQIVAEVVGIFEEVGE